jgi:hypothetical protein
MASAAIVLYLSSWYSLRRISYVDSLKICGIVGLIIPLLWWMLPTVLSVFHIYDVSGVPSTSHPHMNVVTDTVWYIFFILRLGPITWDQALYFWILHSITLPTISGPAGPPVRTQPLPIMLTWKIQQIRKCQQSVALLAHSLCCYRVVLNRRLFARRTLTVRVFEILQVTLYTTDVISLRTLTTYF